MKCYCCSIRKGFFESFAKLDTEKGIIYLCPNCNELLYKIRSSYKSDNSKQNRHCVQELKSRKKDPNDVFIQWEKVFLSKNSL